MRIFNRWIIKGSLMNYIKNNIDMLYQLNFWWYIWFNYSTSNLKLETGMISLKIW